jgi:hypothetical protein
LYQQINLAKIDRSQVDRDLFRVAAPRARRIGSSLPFHFSIP